jgi:DNA-binding response OmpR family regulator
VVNGDVPLVVCVSTDVGLREQVVRRLDNCGPVLICADLDELRAMLFPDPHADRQSRTPAVGPVAVGDLVVDSGAHVVTWRGVTLPLTRLERALLSKLADPPPAVWTYQRLFQAVWGGSYLGDTSILHSAVKRLRRKLRSSGGLSVETVRGVGYRLQHTSADA